MTYLYLLIGLIPPAVCGWLLLGLLQGKTRVLLALEQWAMGTAVGLLFNMLIVFTAHATLGVPLTFLGYAGVQAGLLLILGSLWAWRLRGIKAPAAPMQEPLPRTLKIILGVLCAFVAVKAVVLAVTFLTLTPTFLDDTLDNWNLRGKVFYFDQALTLVMPGEDPLTSPKDISSYSPAVPLMKTWLATIQQEWTDALVNSIHIVWYVVALLLVYFAVRRLKSSGWALLGVYAIGSMPLYMMHGTNPYADAFVSVHVFIAISLAFFGLREADPARRMSFFRIGALAAGLLPFTKNEGLLVYLPPLLLILCIGLFLQWRTQRITSREIINILLWYGGCIVVLSAPWLLFKWMNGMTFGNAKPISTIGIGWQQGVLVAIFVNTFTEGNWLLLFPLIILLLGWRRRAAFGKYLPLTAFFLIVYLGQLALFLFTGLSPEARMQTGLARGVVQQMPVIILIVTLLLADAGNTLVPAFEKVYGKLKKNKEIQE
jgi:hypothetical protein